MKFIYEGKFVELRYGSVVIVVIISCINMLNFSVMFGVGLVVKKVMEFGLEVSLLSIINGVFLCGGLFGILNVVVDFV